VLSFDFNLVSSMLDKCAMNVCCIEFDLGHMVGAKVFSTRLVQRDLYRIAEKYKETLWHSPNLLQAWCISIFLLQK